MFSNPGIFQKKGYVEAFFSHNLWAKVIDGCFENDFLVQRGEITSNATKLKLNTRLVRLGLSQIDTPSEPLNPSLKLLRVQTGLLSDALFQDSAMSSGLAFEYGASECAREFSGEFAPKYVEDQVKLVILLRDQLVFMNKWTSGSSDILRNAQTVGFMTSGRLFLLFVIVLADLPGLVYQSMRLACPAGNVMTLSTGSFLVFPHTIEEFGDVVPIITDVLECHVFLPRPPSPSFPLSR